MPTCTAVRFGESIICVIVLIVVSSVIWCIEKNIRHS